MQKKSLPPFCAFFHKKSSRKKKYNSYFFSKHENSKLTGFSGEFFLFLEIELWPLDLLGFSKDNSVWSSKKVRCKRLLSQTWAEEREDADACGGVSVEGKIGEMWRNPNPIGRR